MKGDTKYKMWCFGVGRGHSESLEIAPFSMMHCTWVHLAFRYDLLSCLHCFWDVLCTAILTDVAMLPVSTVLFTIYMFADDSQLYMHTAQWSRQYSISHCQITALSWTLITGCLPIGWSSIWTRLSWSGLVQSTPSLWEMQVSCLSVSA